MAMSKGRARIGVRGRQLILSASTIALLGVVGILVQTSEGSASLTPPTIPSDLTGSALATELGLELFPEFSPGCYYFAEVSDPAGYCLDAVVSTNLEAWDLAHRLRGSVPTELDMKIFVLSDQIATAGEIGDTATIEELTPQLEELIRQREAQTSGE